MYLDPVEINAVLRAMIMHRAISETNCRDLSIKQAAFSIRSIARALAEEAVALGFGSVNIISLDIKVTCDDPDRR